MIDDEAAWAAVIARDARHDGAFVFAVRTTGVYCRPSCPARRPLRRNVTFFPDTQKACDAGFRPCQRCRPDGAPREHVAVARACALIDAAEHPVRLAALAEMVGYAPHHFQRLFTRAMGMSPAAYARAVRAKRLQLALEGGEDVANAIYDAGYAAPSRAYADAGAHMGMTPGAWARGGAGADIACVVRDSALGRVLIAATGRGVCRIAFDEDEAALRQRFPRARIWGGDAAFAALADAVVAFLDDPSRTNSLPLDLAGTPFQMAVWRALLTIPAGETRSYAQLAQQAGRPGAVRAAGSACGANPLAVVVPCHRVTRSDGGLGGYAWGIERKRALLRQERGEE